MAAVIGTNIQAFGHTTPAGSQRKFSDGIALLTCFLTVGAFTGTYASADDATVDAKTAIQNSRRDGKAVTLYSACAVSPGKEAGVVVGMGPALTISGTNIVGQLTQADGSTERANGAMGTFDEGLTLAVTYKLANPE